MQRALALPASQAVDRHESLLNLGMDSLMAMELRNRLLSAIGVRVAVADLLEGASVTDIGRMLMRDLVIEDAEQALVTADDGVGGGAAMIGALAYDTGSLSPPISTRTEELLASLAAAGAELWVEDGSLRFRAPSG